MAAKTSWHRYGMKLRHRHPMRARPEHEAATVESIKRFQ